MESNKPEEENVESSKKALGNYARYTGIAFQMLAIIAVFSYIGYKIDEQKNSHQPIYTAILGVLGVCVSLYQVIRSLKKMKS